MNSEKDSHREYVFQESSFSDDASSLIEIFMAEQKKHITNRDAATKHAFDVRMNASLVLKNIERSNFEKSFCVITKSGDSIVGISITLVNDEDEVIDNFVGVDFSHLRKGIATELFRKTHTALKKNGINHYRTSLQENSLKAILNAVGQRNVQEIQRDNFRILCEITIP